MRVVTNNALLRPGVVGDHDLTLLQRPARHSFMAKGAELSRVGRDDHFEILRVFRAGGSPLVRVGIVALAAGPVTHLAFNDLSDIGTVVHAIGPLRELLRMA